MEKTICALPSVFHDWCLSSPRWFWFVADSEVTTRKSNLPFSWKHAIGELSLYLFLLNVFYIQRIRDCSINPFAIKAKDCSTKPDPKGNALISFIIKHIKIKVYSLGLTNVDPPAL